MLPRTKDHSYYDIGFATSTNSNIMILRNVSVRFYQQFITNAILTQ